MKWTEVLEETRLSEEAREVVEVEGESLLLIRLRGEVYTMEVGCPHVGAPLKNGRITEESFLVCPWHHSAFDLRTGDVASWTPWPQGVGLVLGALRREHTLPVLPVKVEAGRVWEGV